MDSFPGGYIVLSPKGAGLDCCQWYPRVGISTKVVEVRWDVLDRLWSRWIFHGFDSIGNIRDIQAIWRYTTLQHYVDQLSSKHSKVGIGGDMALVVFFLWRKDMLLPLFLPWDLWFAILYR